MTQKKVITTDKAAAAIGPYSQVIVAHGMVFCSGQIALTPSGELVTGEIEAEVRQAMDNLKVVLEEAGSGLSKVVQTSLFLVDMDDFSRINAVYAEYFPVEPPARACLAVKALPKNARFEIVATALL